MSFSHKRPQMLGSGTSRKVNFARIVKLTASSFLVLFITFAPFLYFPKLVENSNALLSSIKNLKFFGGRSDIDRYQYFEVKHPFFMEATDLTRISELTRVEFRNMILQSAPSELRKRLDNYLDWTLEYSQQYQVDPFWVLAIMWTESHFRQNTQSYMNAIGLMQIMPDTAHFISQVMNRPVSPSKALELIRKPKDNIEMGVVYLDRLLKLFRYKYEFATVAYNVGPARLKDQSLVDAIYGNNNRYLAKVAKNYNRISRYFVKYISNTPKAYLSTLAVAPVIPPSELRFQFSLVQSDWNRLTPMNLLELEDNLLGTAAIITKL